MIDVILIMLGSVETNRYMNQHTAMKGKSPVVNTTERKRERERTMKDKYLQRNSEIKKRVRYKKPKSC